VSVTAPPRPPGPGGLVDRDELEALVEALIEEARRRTQRRRRRNGACFLLALLAGGGLYAGLSHLGGGTTGAATASAGDAAAAGRSGGTRWGLPHGPQGGPGNTVAVAPSAPDTVYLGTGRGVFRSTNGGRSWTSAGLVQKPTSSGSSVPGVSSLSVDPRTPNIVYAGLNSQWDGGKWNGGTTYRRAVFKTTDGGKTWRGLHLIGQPVAISPTGPPILYAAAGGVGGRSRLFRSMNGGHSWQPADRGLPSTYLWALAFDLAAPGTVYAAMGQRGIFESRDGGAKWRAVRVSVAHRTVTAIAVDPRQPQTIYAGTDAGVIKSLDGGIGWRMVNTRMGGHGRDRDYMQVTALLVDGRDSRTVYASADCAGVFKSTDGGHSWASASRGLAPQCGWSYALALDPRTPQVAYAADRVHGVLKSLDGGAQWHPSNNGLSLTTVSSLAVDPLSPRTVYASAGPLGLFKSSDTGAHWRPLASAPHLVEDIALDPGNPRNMLAVAAAYGVFRSTDAGRTWTQARFGADARSVTVVAISGTTAYAGTHGHGLFGSTDGGRSWRPLGLAGAHVQTLAISPADPAVVYAGVFGSQARGLYKSTDGGGSWQRLTDALDIDVSVFVLDPKNPTTVYIGTGGENGVLKSTDGGGTWHSTSSGLPQWRVKDRTHRGKWITLTVDVTALAIDPAHPQTLYAATAWRGIFQSTNAGKSWHSFNAGLTDLDVRVLALDATGRTLYAGTTAGGVVSLHRAP
jgi:photosystem II stability/assembly factor-like uncharacterized protein